MNPHVPARAPRSRLLLILCAVAVFDIAAGTALCVTTDSAPGAGIGAALILGSFPLGITIVVLGWRDLAAMRRGEITSSARTATRLACAGGGVAAMLSVLTTAVLLWIAMLLIQLA